MDSKYKMKDNIERIFLNLIARMEMDIPENYEDIVQYIYEEVLETADPIHWSVGDVVIGFRRWIEDKK